MEYNISRNAKESYLCANCFDMIQGKIKRENVVRMPKRTIFYRECDGCGFNKDGICIKCRKGDTLGISDYEDVPFSHRCIFGRSNKNGKVTSMSELCCPVCHNIVHRIIGENIIISIIGARDSGKSHYIGILLHELMDRLAKQFEWVVVPEENTMKLYEMNFERIYTTNQSLNLTVRNYDGFYEPYIFYITDKKGKTFTFTIFDTAGEDFESDDIMETFAKHIFHASGIVFLVDPLKILNVSVALDQEIVTNSSSVSAKRTFQNDAMLTILSNHLRRHYKIRESKKIPIPMGVVIPKIDVVATTFPVHYASLFQSSHGKRQGFVTAENRRVNTEMKKWLSSLGDGALNSFMAQLEMNYTNVSYFAVSSLGMKNAPDKNGVFAKPKPHRIEDPILWILKEKGIIQEKK